MINVNTLDTLNRIAFGADIDSLESYIIDFREASKLEDMSQYEFRYRQLEKLLRELKPDSAAFDSIGTDSVLSLGQSLIINSLGNEEEKLIFNYIGDEKRDIIAFANVDGLEIRVTYRSGKFESIKVNDDTELKDKVIIDELLPIEVEAFKSYDLIELKGKLLSSRKKKSLNMKCTVINSIRTGIELEALRVLFYDADIVSGDFEPFETQRETLEFIQDAGIDIVYHALVRNISYRNVMKAIRSLYDYIDCYEKNTDYKVNGIRIMDNNIKSKLNNAVEIYYCPLECDTGREFIGRVKDIEYGEKIRVLIEPVKCTDKIIVDRIEIHDLCILDSIQDEIRFRVVESEPEILLE